MRLFTRLSSCILLCALACAVGYAYMLHRLQRQYDEHLDGIQDQMAHVRAEVQALSVKMGLESVDDFVLPVCAGDSSCGAPVSVQGHATAAAVPADPVVVPEDEVSPAEPTTPAMPAEPATPAEPVTPESPAEGDVTPPIREAKVEVSKGGHSNKKRKA